VTLPTVSATASIASPPPLEQGALHWSGSHANVDERVVSVFGMGRDLFAIGPAALRHSSDGGVHWSETRNQGGSAIWGASIDELWIAGNGVVRSVDRGATWTRVPAIQSGVLFVVGGRAGEVIAGGTGVLERSMDHGATWTLLQHGIADATFHAIATLGSDVFIAGHEVVRDPSSSIGYHTESILLRSSDGVTFTRLVAPKPGMTSNEESRGVCFTASGKMVLAMSYSVYASLDRGATWQRAADVGTEVLGLACRGREIMIAARNKRFLRSSDDGATFDEHDLDGILGPELIALESVWIGADGAALVAGEAYSPHEAGTLLMRAR
jgi:hypothetical protein